MRTFSVRATIGALMDSTPMVRTRMLSANQQRDIASLRQLIKGFAFMKQLTQDLRAPAYWEVMLEIDKVAVKTIQNQIDSYVATTTVVSF